MRQKVIYIDPTSDSSALSRLAERLHVGDEVILMECRYREGDTYYEIVKHTGEGYPCNANKEIKRYHGWLGTTDGYYRYAHGVRKVTEIALADEFAALSRMMEGKALRRCDMHRIVVGKYLHPEWD